MGYFSNGTEGDIYEEQYCSRCIHYPEKGFCPVWAAHLFYNHGRSEDANDILNLLIPEGKIQLPDGREIPGNLQCSMFVEAKDAV
jgi:hypothetical protein